MPRSWILITLFAAACGGSAQPAPSPGPGTGTGDSITGRERIGWNQPAGDFTQLDGFRYAIYVDGARSELAEVACSGAVEATGFPCSARLPSMSNGSHTLELASFILNGGDVVESPRSPTLRVTVSALTAATREWTDGEIEPTRDGLRLRVDKLAEGLDRPVDAAFDPQNRLFIAERAGRIRLFAEGTLRMPDALVLQAGDDQAGASILSIAVDPDFTRSHFIFVTHTALTADGPVIRLSRYRELRGTLAERAVLFETPAASTEGASAAARFGSDGKIYIALNDGGTGGQLIRLNADGTRPRDQAGSTPAIAAGVEAVRGLAWDPQSGLLWIADDNGDEAHLSGLSISNPPVRAIVRGRRAVRAGLGSYAFYASDAIPEMRDDALIPAAEGYLLRLRFADDKPTSIARSERLLDQRVGPLRIAVVGTEGAIYFCTDTTLGRLTASRIPRD